MEYENKHFASRGVAGSGLGLGIAGTALGVLNGGLGNILCGGNNGCSEDHWVNRYEASQSARIAELETEVKLRDSNIYTDQKMLEMYKYIDGRLNEIGSVLGQQAVHNQKTEDSFTLVSHDLGCVKRELSDQIRLEAERRCCGDNAIVSYANATFYPKMVADVTVGTTTTAQTLYNPLPDCGCCNR